MDIEKKKSAERVAIKGEAKSKNELKTELKNELKTESESKSESKQELKTEIHDATKSPTNPSWSHIESDLKDALNTWSDLTHELANKISPEEKQLQEIKSLLGTLRDKLKEFSEDSNENLAHPPKDEKPGHR